MQPLRKAQPIEVMKTLILLLLVFASMTLITGCETTAPGTKPNQEQIFLRKGMIGSEIVSLLGEPLKVVKPDTNNENKETWIYEDSREHTRLVQADTREVPYINPITREDTTRTEVINKLKTDRITLVTELFLKDGILTGWKETQHESSSFQD